MSERQRPERSSSSRIGLCRSHRGKPPPFQVGLRGAPGVPNIVPPREARPEGAPSLGTTRSTQPPSPYPTRLPASPAPGSYAPWAKVALPYQVTTTQNQKTKPNKTKPNKT